MAERILVVNAGSSSLKVALYEAEGLVEVDRAQRRWQVSADGSRLEPLRRATRELVEPRRQGVVAVGHRVVHGGTAFSRTVRLDPEVKRVLEGVSALAPLHNPPALAALEAVEALLPEAVQVAAFDTAFHATLAPVAYVYPLPYRWYRDLGIRRFGFHGLSHSYASARATDLLRLDPAQARVVTCHLGAGASLCAVAGGRSVATTMGYTPLEGIMMATRGGSVDPGILLHLLRQGMTVEELALSLAEESGLKGVSERSGDMAELLKAEAEGDPQAALAVDLYVLRVRQGIAAMAATMNGLDAIVFTGGVGEHAFVIRQRVVEGLAFLGAALDPERNAQPPAGDADLSAPGARVKVVRVHAREEWVIAREVQRLLEREGRSDS